MFLICNTVQSKNDITILNNRIEKIRSDLQFQIDKKTKELQTELSNTQQQLINLEVKNDSLCKELSKNIKENAKISQDNYSNASKQINNVKSDSESNFKKLLIWGSIASVIILLISSILYMVLHRGINKKTDAIIDIRKTQEKLQKAQNKLQEESASLDTKMIEILNKKFNLEQQHPKVENISKQVVVDHDLALKMADEITRIEKNLSRMDTSIKGYKPLVKAIERIKDNFKANGYEIETYIGQTYNEGMRVNPDFIIDEELPFGTRIITSVSKPQVHYNGELIQKATLTVSQNI